MSAWLGTIFVTESDPFKTTLLMMFTLLVTVKVPLTTRLLAMSTLLLKVMSARLVLGSYSAPTSFTCPAMKFCLVNSDCM